MQGGSFVVLLFDSAFKVTYAMSKEEISLYRSTLIEKGKDFPSPMSQEITTESIGLSLYKNNFITHVTVKTTDRLIESGIIQQIYKYFYNDLLNPRIPPEENHPKVFSMNDLKFGFVICFWAGVVSCCVFVGEILFFYFWAIAKYFGRQGVGLFYFLRILKDQLRIFR